MSKEIYISSTPHETRLAIVESDDLTEIYYERENEYTLAGSIYNGKVTRVLPGMQSSFVDIGLERDAFLYITDFMEEAGDSAEFDSADGGARRAGRDDRGGDRGASRDDRGGNRDDQSNRAREDRTPRIEGASPREEVAPTLERSAGATGSTDGRGDRNERGEREGGRRRRGNRDARSGNREPGSAEDRGGNRDRSSESRTPSPNPAEASLEAIPAIDSGYIEPSEDRSSTELGEGAPGADGSRRWRGRRGRRRGRSSAQRDETQVPQQTAELTDASPEAATGRVYQADFVAAEEPEENFDEEYVDSVDLDASAATLASPLPPAPAVEAPEPARPISTDRPTGDRGGQAEPRRRSDRESGDRNRRDRSSRAPRGFAPSRALYGVDSVPEADDQPSGGPAPEPLILPGESLGKYRKAEEGQAASPASSIPPPPAPSTEFVLGAAWDGGNVLPGETIRPRSTPDRSGSDRPYGDRQAEGRGSRDRGGDNRRGRDDRSARGGRPDRDRSTSFAAPESQVPLRSEPSRLEQASPQASQPSELSAPMSERSASTSEIPELQFVEPGLSLDASAEQTGQPVPAPSTSTLSETSSVFDASLLEAPQPPLEIVDYEPTEASASVRFDPATRSEYRQGSSAVEVPEVPEPTAIEEVVSPFDVESPSYSDNREAEPAFHEDISAIGHQASSVGADTPTSGELQTPAAHETSIAHTITPQPDTAIAPIHTEGFGGEIEPAALTHEFTSIQNTGEMLSEVPTPPQVEIAEPTSPLHHETAVLDAVVQAESSPQSSIDTPSGSMEEEVLEEEDFNTTTLHASSIEEMDYEEEETLEGAADLGTMIREMSIDQITRTGEDPEEDEDILEEEDAVDDHLNGSYEDTEEDEDEQQPNLPGEIVSGGEEGEFTSSSEQAYTAGSQPEAPGSGFDAARDPDRRSGRRDGRGRDTRGRDGRGRDRDRAADRARPTGGSGDRSTSRPGRRDGRHSVQMTNLPAISDLLKPGQEVLVQIAKEPIAKKGARITSHIALPGRFLVFMPTVNHTGVSRKIESDGERRRLKEILLSEKGDASGGFIVRTAASGASEEELRSDLRFLLNLWADIKQRSESSKSPALIYHDLNLVERILRDQVTDTFSAIWVDTETEYERVLRFLQRFQPSLIRRVKLYTKETPLFEQFGITEEINKALRSKVWLKSGGSIVINQTEALVAIDINTGKFVGKTARLEDTIVKTNLDAIPEIVRQIRLRDLGGIIIIDFIDMDERRNRTKVMAALEEELKKDRAPSKVLQFNDFGLVAITRKRVKQSLERTLSATCNVCQGTGMTKSPVTVCNDIYIEMRKMQKHLDRGDVMLRVNPDVVKQLKAPGTRWLQEMEEMVGKTILVKSDPGLHPEQFDIH